METSYVNQTGSECNCIPWWCTDFASSLAKSVGTVGEALIYAKAGKKPPNQNQQPTTNNNNDNPKPKPSIFTPKRIAIGSVVGILVIAGVAAGIWAAKHRS